MSSSKNPQMSWSAGQSHFQIDDNINLLKVSLPLYLQYFKMGQANNGRSHPSEYILVRDVPNGSIIRESSNGRLHFVKEYSFTNQQAYQQAFVNFSKKLPQKHQHILYLERTNTKLQNTFCSTFYKISLLYQYLEHTLDKEIRQRIQEKKVFDEKEVWSVLCSCALAVSQMIRFQGRSHAALRTKDLRLTHEGVVKILSLEMVGMEPDHDPNQEGTVKQLALTILNCILMDEITNQSQDFLLELIDALDSSPEMKSILRIMLNPSTRFVDLEEYLFKLVQEDTESLNSYSHTPIIKEKAAKNNSYSRIPEESKEDDSLVNLARDSEDNPQIGIIQPYTQEIEIPDENDIIDDNKSKADSQRQTLRDKNHQTPNSQQHQSNSKQQEFTYTNNANQHSLFTDPKLLNLISSNLQQINKRKSTANSRKLAYSQSSSKIESSNSKQLNTNTYNANSVSNLNIGPSKEMIQANETGNTKVATVYNSNANLSGSVVNRASGVNVREQSMIGRQSNQIRQSNVSIKQSNIKQSNIQIRQSNVKESNVSSNSHVKSQKENQSRATIREDKNGLSRASTVKIQQNIKNEKLVKTNEDKKNKLVEKRYQNIMEMEDMGFKKNKAVKSKEEIKEIVKQQIRATFNPAASNSNTMVYNSISSSSYNSNTLPLSNASDKNNTKSNVSQQNNRNNIQYTYNEPRQEFQYVSETYLKGKYEGTKFNNMRHGKGAFYYNEGGKYIGQWKQNKMDGRGVLYYPNNSIAYDGQWKADQLQGKGTLYNEQVSELNTPFDYKNWYQVDQYWIKYQGEFLEDSKNGMGKLYLSNGQIFEGHFKNDAVWGEGVLLRKDGSRVRGLWKQNMLIKLF